MPRATLRICRSTAATDLTRRHVVR